MILTLFRFWYCNKYIDAQNVDIFSELECLDDFIPQTLTNTGNYENFSDPYFRVSYILMNKAIMCSQTGNEESQLQSERDTDSKHVNKFLTSYGSDLEVENSIKVTCPVEDFSSQAHYSIDSSAFTMCEEVPVNNKRSEIKAGICLMPVCMCL